MSHRLSQGAKRLLTYILINVQGDSVLPRALMAADLGVTMRTVDRWLVELRQYNALQIDRYGRHNLYSVTADNQTTNSRQLADPTISDRSLIDRRSVANEMSAIFARFKASGHDSIDSILSTVDTWGGESLSSKNILDREAPPPLAPAGEIFKLLTGMGFWPNVARELESSTLAGCSVELVQADYQRLRDLGKHHGAIVEHWRVCAPSTATARPAGGWPELVTQITGDPKYNGLFRSGSDISPEEAAELQRMLDRSDPNVDTFLNDCGL